MANIPTKNYQNLISGFQVTVENVWDVFLRHSVCVFLTTENCFWTHNVHVKFISKSHESFWAQTFLIFRTVGKDFTFELFSLVNFIFIAQW